MRPVNQLPLSLSAMKCSPLASRRMPDRPPKPGKDEVSTSPLRYSSEPKRTCERSRGSKEAIGRAFTAIATGSVTECSWMAADLADSWVAACASAKPGPDAAESPAADISRNRRRESLLLTSLRVQAARPRWRRSGRWGCMRLTEQLGELFSEGAAELLGIHDRDRAAIIARHIMTNADRDQLDRRARLDLLDDMAQVPLEIVAGIDRQRGIIDRRTVRDHHQDLALLRPREQALVRPVQRLAVDILLEQPFAHHQAKILARTPPGRIRRLVDDVTQIVQPSRIRRLAGGKPGFARLPALPGAGGEAENLDLDAATLERAGENVGAGRGDRDRTSAHRAGIVEQQRHHGVAEGRLLLMHEGQRVIGIDHHARQPRRIQDAFLEVELPGAVLLRHQPPLQPVGEPRHNALQMCELLVEIGAQPLQFVVIAQVLGRDDLVEFRCEGVYSGPRGSLVPALFGRVASPGVSSSPSSPSSNVSLVEACALSIALSDMSSVVDCAWSAVISSAASLSGEPSAPDWSLSPSRLSSWSSSSSVSALRSSPSSSAESRSCTRSPNLAWSSVKRLSLSSRVPILSSRIGRQRSTIFFAAAGGASPVRRSRTIMASASDSGASARSVISSNLPRWK